MKYKEIFRRAVSVITTPGETWDKLSIENQNSKKEDFSFFNVLLALCMVTSFAGGLLYRQETIFVSSIVCSIIIGVSFYSGFWAIYYVFAEILCKHFRIQVAQSTILRLITYSMTLSLLLNIFISLLPELFFLKIINIYTLYIVWEGASRFIQLEENKKSNFVLILSVLIIFLPVAINRLLLIIFPIAKI
ncbi:MAG: YIP1 family protein [Prevotellaceae bacterium]|jgi:hypothetical protein|nr:YIP1 family protein [Prevotellaceae bacterium]